MTKETTSVIINNWAGNSGTGGDGEAAVVGVDFGVEVGVSVGADVGAWVGAGVTTFITETEPLPPFVT